MSFTSYIENMALLLIGGFVVRLFRKSLNLREFKITFIAVLVSYSVLYSIGYFFHSEELIPFTVHLKGQHASMSIIGLLLLVASSWLFVYILNKFMNK